MSLNVSVLTGNTQSLVERSIDEYNKVVLTHLYGDYSQHTQVRVYATPYTEPSTGHVVSSHTLRLQVTHPTAGAIAIDVPCVPTSTTVLTDGPPVFIGQPNPAQAVAAGANVQFEIYVASTTMVHYQWQKNSANITGETQDLLFLPTVERADAGIYRCLATNAYGQTVSANGTLFVT